MAKAIEAARAFFKIYTEDSAFRRSISGIEAKLKSTGTAIAGMGAKLGVMGTAIGGSLVAAAAKFASYGASLDDASRRTGVSAEQLSALAFAAEQSGTDMKTLEGGLLRMSKQLSGSAPLSDGLQGSLAALGLTLGDLQGKSPDQQFSRIAQAISQVSDPSRQSALAMEIFGKAGAKLLPLLKEGSGGIAAMTEEAKRMGIVMSGEQVAAAAVLDDAWQKLQATFRGAVVQIGAALAPTLITLSEQIASGVANVTKWISENESLIQNIALLAAGLTGAGLGLTALGLAMTTASTAMGAFTLATKAASVALAFLNANPLVAVASALALGVTAWIAWGDAAEDSAARALAAAERTAAAVKKQHDSVNAVLIAAVRTDMKNTQEIAARTKAAAPAPFLDDPAKAEHPLVSLVTRYGNPQVLKSQGLHLLGVGLRNALEALPSAQAGTEQVARRLQSGGTFEGIAAAQIFGGKGTNLGEKQLKEETEQTKLLTKIEKKLPDEINKLLFL